jgi:hypothetical protein
MSLLGSLTQLIDVRPDLAFAVSFVAQHTSHCTEQDMMALHRIVGFLYSTRDDTLTLRPGDQSLGRVFIQLRGFADAAFASHPDGRSQLAYSFDLVPADAQGDTLEPQLDNLPSGMFISKSMLCPTIALSSPDSEISAKLECLKVAIFLRALLKDLHFDQHHPTPIFNDNQSAISLSSRYSGSQKRIRYILPKIMFMLEQFKDKVFQPVYLSSPELVVDINTKSMSGTNSQTKRRKLLGLLPTLPEYHATVPCRVVRSRVYRTLLVICLHAFDITYFSNLNYDFCA